ncbi:tetratricopeptide repeat protein [Oleidesulfovibrio sp.]|uniref:tetratricopeptide repeat protein n=1 Tax=Oleidesulfovibrio sp. TaxID=2909707 RepID=UPI003A88A211
MLALAVSGCSANQSGYQALLQSRYDDAGQAYESCLADACSDLRSRVRYAFVLYKTQQYQQALDLLDALKAHPDVAEFAFYWSGLVHLVVGDRHQAILDWRQCEPDAFEVRKAVYTALWAVENSNDSDLASVAQSVDVSVQAAYGLYLSRVKHDPELPAAYSDAGLNRLSSLPSPYIP